MMNDESVLSRTPPPYDHRLIYGPDPLHFGDLRLPRRKGLHPALLFIHGGFWRAKYDLTHASHLCAALTSAGIATLNVEYRRVGNPGGGWPGSFEDVDKAFRFLLGIADKYQFDCKRIAVMGHSAGGQLALLLARHESGPRAAISLAGVVDLKRAYELHLSNDAVVGFLGGSPEEVADRYAEASPIEVPVPKRVRQIIVHGVKDDVVPVSFSRDYVQRKKKLGENVAMLELPAAGHYELIDPLSKEWKQIEAAIKDGFALE